MQKKSFAGLQYFFLSLMAFILFSCSNLQQEKRSEEDALSLKETAAARAMEIPWTGTLEGNRLTSEISTQSGISRSVPLTPLSMIAGGEESDVLPIFPFLKDFGSLDTSLLSEDVVKVLNGFCTAISKGQNADSYMAAECLYQLALFIRDMELYVPEKKSEELKDEKKESAETGDKKEKAEDKAEGEKSDADGEKKSEPGYTFFDSYFYGQPYATGTMFEVPVRFTGSERSADILVFLSKEDGTWKVDELQILKSEIKNGGK